MADGFIVRKGGEAVERTTAPSINFVSKTDSEIVVTFTNNDATEAEVFFGITSTLTDTVTLAAAATSSNITFSGLDGGTSYTVSAYAIVTDTTLKKIKSEIVSTTITTNVIVYTAATGGTTLEYDLDSKRYRSHTFTSNGTFEVTAVGNDDRNQVDYLIIAGGGGGGSGSSITGGQGGGAGGYRTTNGTSGGNSSAESKVPVTLTTFGVTVGAGGGPSTAGSNSFVEFASTITSNGGGGGRAGTNGRGGNGGSGGGGNNDQNGGIGIAGQGFNGGRGGIFTNNHFGGGGGGAGSVGGQGGQGVAPRGDGLANLLRTGSNETRALGGGRNSGDGANNTGTGGQASEVQFNFAFNPGNGGSGIVIIRYEIAPSV